MLGNAVWLCKIVNEQIREIFILIFFNGQFSDVLSQVWRPALEGEVREKNEKWVV